jgi:hypothetical protein
MKHTSKWRKQAARVGACPVGVVRVGGVRVVGMDSIAGATRVPDLAGIFRAARRQRDARRDNNVAVPSRDRHECQREPRVRATEV